jgi:hypothetical protein
MYLALGFPCGNISKNCFTVRILTLIQSIHITQILPVLLGEREKERETKSREREEETGTERTEREREREREREC